MNGSRLVVACASIVLTRAIRAAGQIDAEADRG